MGLTDASGGTIRSHLTKVFFDMVKDKDSGAQFHGPRCDAKEYDAEFDQQTQHPGLRLRASTRAVRRWVDEFVVGHNFCPWAGPALAVGGVRVVASDARSAEGVLVDLRAEAEALPPGGSAPCEGQAVTTLLACPHVAEWGSPSAFQAFYDTVLASGYVFASLELYIPAPGGDAGARPQLAAGDRLQLGEGPSGVPVLATVLDPSAGFGEGGQRLARVQVDGRGETFISAGGRDTPATCLVRATLGAFCGSSACRRSRRAAARAVRRVFSPARRGPCSTCCGWTTWTARRTATCRGGTASAPRSWAPRPCRRCREAEGLCSPRRCMWEWLLRRGPEYLAQGLVNYAARCPAIPACPASGCPPCPGLVCGDCAVPACPACPACLGTSAPPAAAEADCRPAEAEAACRESGLGLLAYLIFLLGVVVGALVVSSGWGCLRVLRRIGRAAVKKTESEDELELRLVNDFNGRARGAVEPGYRDVPAGVPRDRVYRFRREPSAARDAEFQQAAEAEAGSEGRLLADAQGVAPPPAGFVWLLPIDAVGQVVGADAGALVAAAAPAAPAAVPGAVPVGALVAGAAAAAAAPVAAPAPRLQGPLQGVAPVGALPGVATLWRAAESGGGFRFGDPVAGHVRTARALGTKDLHVLADGAALFVEEVSPASETSFFDKGVSGDARIMAMRRNSQGRRERTWAAMVADVAREEGLGLGGHRERFRSARKLESSSWGVSEHYCVAQALELGLLTDQVDGSNPMMVESLFRRPQTIEFAHSERAREQEAKGCGGKLSPEEQMAFNPRKAREEREAARKDDKSKKGNDNG
ncbi:unnamed protein product [Prorocentrum cordatum]|uniref:Uncharacterized protein n=1 Tax=Prorocentrum cordatum TaxID=2364126 RepID=A0ABN9Q8Y7_9DINO|nr:unnamed protein product [Polarella glacialis]